MLDLEGLQYFNVGSETGTKIIDVVDEIIDIVGETPIQHLGERPGDVEASYAWSEKLAKATGWRAQVDLREGLERTVDWFRHRSDAP